MDILKLNNNFEKRNYNDSKNNYDGNSVIFAIQNKMCDNFVKACDINFKK